MLIIIFLKQELIVFFFLSGSFQVLSGIYSKQTRYRTGVSIFFSTLK